jgi:hypothetical protein
MNEFQHRISKQEGVFTIVKSPRHFVKVGRKMLDRAADAWQHRNVNHASPCGSKNQPSPFSAELVWETSSSARIRPNFFSL